MIAYSERKSQSLVSVFKWFVAAGVGLPRNFEIPCHVFSHNHFRLS